MSKLPLLSWREVVKALTKAGFRAATAEKQKSTLVIGSDKEFDGLTLKILKIRI